MNLPSEHTSPDGLLRFVIKRDAEDVSLGFSGFSWHTHADLLAGTYGASEPEAVARFVEELLNDRMVIALSRVRGVVQDVWSRMTLFRSYGISPRERTLSFATGVVTLGGPANNGMHPTADTTVVKYLQRLGAAGDAGRSAATMRNLSTRRTS